MARKHEKYRAATLDEIKAQPNAEELLKRIEQERGGINFVAFVVDIESGEPYGPGLYILHPFQWGKLIADSPVDWFKTPEALLDQTDSTA